QAMDRYVGLSREMDRESVRLMPRAWLVVGVAGLAPAFLAGASAGAIAISIGAILLGYRALERLRAGAMQLIGAAISWRQVRPLFDAAARTEAPGTFVAPAKDCPVVDARELAFAHAGRKPVLEGTSCMIRDGDWVLLEGPSGGGKSTIVSLLAGLRGPSS